MAGVPIVRGVEAIVIELAARRGEWQRVVLARLDTVPSQSLCEIATAVVETKTQYGEAPALSFLDELVAQFELRALAALEKGAAGIRLVIAGTKSGASNGEALVNDAIAQLDKLLRQWIVVAKPIQVAAKSRGARHELSATIAEEVRELSFYLWKNYQMLGPVQAITAIMSECFLYLPVLAERLGEDAKALSERAEERDFGPYLKSLEERYERVAKSAGESPLKANEFAEELLASAPALKVEMQKRNLPLRFNTQCIRSAFAIAAVRCAFSSTRTTTSRWAEGISVTTRARPRSAGTEAARVEIEKALVTLRQREKECAA